MQKPCRSTLYPTACSVDDICPPCTCTPNKSAPYWNNGLFSCVRSTVQRELYGGSPCPKTLKTVSCNMKCPGCEYDGSLCSCNYTTSKINENSLIQLMGTKTCVYPPRKNNEVQCETLTSSYPDTYCSTLLNASECQFSSPICDNLCTPTYTITQATPQTVQGYRLCSLSDSRPFGKLPINWYFF
ncbi:hypothetical protein HMI56_002575 [Coelomomyces lativittatus]|nr:hypothetical protein HMI56_002575 [Coelomomyces lativittatus]